MKLWPRTAPFLAPLATSLLLLALLPGGTGGTYETVVPGDTFALLVLADPAQGLAVLSHPEFSAGDLAAEIPQLADRIPVEILDLLQPALEQVAQLWLVIHSFEQRESGALHPHFSLIIVPRKSSSRADLNYQIDEVLTALFGVAPQSFEEGNARLHVGPGGKTLFEVHTPEFVVLSNSREGWQSVIETWLGERTSLAARPSFRRIRARLSLHDGLFVYCDASRIVGLLPEFGYRVRLRGQRLESEFVPAVD